MENVFFVKQWTFPQRRVQYVQYQYFFTLHFTYLGGGCAPIAPPCLRACVIVRSSAPVTLMILLLINVFFGINNALAVCFAC